MLCTKTSTAYHSKLVNRYTLHTACLIPPHWKPAPSSAWSCPPYRPIWPVAPHSSWPMQQVKHPKITCFFNFPPALTSPNPYDSIMIPSWELDFLCCCCPCLNSAISGRFSNEDVSRDASGSCFFLSQFGSGGLNIVWNLHQLHDSYTFHDMSSLKNMFPNLWDIKTDQPSDYHSWLVDENLCDMWFS